MERFMLRFVIVREFWCWNVCINIRSDLPLERWYHYEQSLLMIIHVCRTSLHITATQLYVWLCSVHAYIAGAVGIVENPGYLMNTSPCLWVYLSCKNAAIDSWRKITHVDVPENLRGRGLSSMVQIWMALRSDCCFGFIWCTDGINVSQSLKLTDIGRLQGEVSTGFFLCLEIKGAVGIMLDNVILWWCCFPSNILNTSKIYQELAFPAPWANLRNTWSIHIDYGHAAMYAGRKQVACTQRSRKGSLSSSFCRCDSRRCTVPRNATSKRVNCLCKVIFALFRASSSAHIGIACSKYVQSTILKRYLDEGRLLIHQECTVAVC